MFSFAEYFKKHPPKHFVILAVFDAEELGLQGSNYFVNNPIVLLKSIEKNINVDMISQSDKNELFAVGTRFNTTLRRIVLNSETPKTIELHTDHVGADGKENWTH